MSERRKRLFFTLQRWANIFGYTLIGSAIVAYCGDGLAAWGSRVLARLTEGNSTAGVCLGIIATATALSFCHRLLGTRLQHLQFAYFPPLPIAVIASFIAAPLWPPLRDAT